MLERAQKNGKIDFLLNKVITEIKGDKTVTAVLLKDTQTGEMTEKKVDGVFMAIGHTPNTRIFEKKIN